LGRRHAGFGGGPAQAQMGGLVQLQSNLDPRVPPDLGPVSRSAPRRWDFQSSLSGEEHLTMFETNQEVQHPRFGTGTVLLDQGATVVVRFGDRLEACLAGDLTRRLTVGEALSFGAWSPSLPVRLKAQAAAICSLNDAWGVFSRSRIDLLPHKLWVCHRALQQPWPIRFLIADDVRLGKTVEAGLILWPLIAACVGAGVPIASSMGAGGASTRPASARGT